MNKTFKNYLFIGVLNRNYNNSHNTPRTKFFLPRKENTECPFKANYSVSGLSS